MRGIPESWIQRVVAQLRQPVRMDEEFDRNVMNVVRSLPRHRWGTWARVLRPRTITVRPVLSSIAATLIFGVSLSAGHAQSTSRALRPASPPNAVSADRRGHGRIAGRGVGGDGSAKAG